jgi:predicted nucleic acid-binding protein
LDSDVIIEWLRGYQPFVAKSHSVELGDALIAACASSEGLKLWTLNKKHYPMKDIDFHE